jgi:hypothetical protein
VNAEQASLDFDPRSWAEKRSDAYRTRLAEQARSTSLRAAGVGDPDGHDLAVRTICRLLTERETVTADDVQAVTPIRSNAIGSAFAALSRAGEITVKGYTTAKAPQAHGRLVRIWGYP